MPADRTIVIAGTDTGVGKTVFAAALAGALDAGYWKPIQAGLDGPTDSETVADLGGLLPERIHREAYCLNTPSSPHRAAEIDGFEIDIDGLQLPPISAPLVIELAGGLMVPLTRSVLQIDVLAKWQARVVLVARTSLGTINHALLSLEAMRSRGIDVAGVAFVGEENEASEAIIQTMGDVRRLGRLPVVTPLVPERLAVAFADNFALEDFA